MTQKKDTSKLYISIKAEKADFVFSAGLFFTTNSQKDAASIQAACEAMAEAITHKLIEKNIITFKME